MLHLNINLFSFYSDSMIVSVPSSEPQQKSPSMISRVSQPVPIPNQYFSGELVQARGGVHYGAMIVSPRSGEQSGLCHQMLENVLASSPSSFNMRDKFVSYKNIIREK